MSRLPQNAITLAAYLGGVATILVLQAIQPQTQVVVMPSTANILARPPTTAPAQAATEPQPEPELVPACRSNDDCPSPSAVCVVPYGVCEEMRDPACSCSQPQVLRCSDSANRSKHTFCPVGCEGTGNGARCL